MPASVPVSTKLLGPQKYSGKQFRNVSATGSMHMVDQSLPAACNLWVEFFFAFVTFHPGLRKTRSPRRNNRCTLWSYQACVMMMQALHVISSNLCPKYAWPYMWTRTSEALDVRYDLIWVSTAVCYAVTCYDFKGFTIPNAQRVISKFILQWSRDITNLLCCDLWGHCSIDLSTRTTRNTSET